MNAFQSYCCKLSLKMYLDVSKCKSGADIWKKQNKTK